VGVANESLLKFSGELIKPGRANGREILAISGVLRAASRSVQAVLHGD